MMKEVRASRFRNATTLEKFEAVSHLRMFNMPSAFSLLVSILPMIKISEPGVMDCVLHAIGECRHPDSLQSLLKVYRESKHIATRVSALRAMSWMAGDDPAQTLLKLRGDLRVSEFPYWVEFLGHLSPRSAKLRSQVRQSLLEALDSSRPDIVALALQSCSRLGIRLPKAIKYRLSGNTRYSAFAEATIAELLPKLGMLRP